MSLPLGNCQPKPLSYDVTKPQISNPTFVFPTSVYKSKQQILLLNKPMFIPQHYPTAQVEAHSVFDIGTDQLGSRRFG